MFIKSIHLKNFLSYGDNSQPVELRPLNLLIGPNGSGKSNLIEALELISAAPKDLLTPIRDGGGIRDWLWKGTEKPPIATINAVFDYPSGPSSLRYKLSFTEVAQRFQVVDERIEREEISARLARSSIYYRFEKGRGSLYVKGVQRTLQPDDIDTTSSILAQRRDPDQYPEVTHLGDMFQKIRIYRDWSFGRYTPPRMPQKADMRNDYLDADCRNLGLVLNQLSRTPDVKRRILKNLQALYDGIDDFHIQVEGGTVQVFLHEGNLSIPATRLSDGTLRYLCLLAILCHPAPPPLICLEEPELGLHPDVLPALAELLKEAAQRTQLIVTTHSDVLVDCMHDQPESVLVAERDANGTRLTRLDAKALAPWLDQYRLGTLWTRGDIGGTRW